MHSGSVEQPTSAMVVVTGAASGMGAAFLKYYATQQSEQAIIAIDRNIVPLPPEVAHPNKIWSLTADVTDSNSMADLSKIMEGIPIRLLIHCVGVRGLVPGIVTAQPGDVAAAETLDVMDAQTMMKAFEVNCIGTFNTIRTLLPGLRQFSTSAEGSSTPPRCVVLGSRMGSVEGNVAGGGYAYRASKAALSAIVKSFSIDIKDVIFTLLHPGRVETGLVDWKEDGAISPEESVMECAKVIETQHSGASGSFIDRFGDQIKW
jgi:NAD(P)-dependent dehydrogenase (short-subunit alcohol dehydrogenase family)